MKFAKSFIIDLFNIRKQKNELLKTEKNLSSEVVNYLENNNLNVLKYKNIQASFSQRTRKEFDPELFAKKYPNINIDEFYIEKPYKILNLLEI